MILWGQERFFTHGMQCGGKKTCSLAGCHSLWSKGQQQWPSSVNEYALPSSENNISSLFLYIFQYILLQKSICVFILFLYLSALRNVKTAMLFSDQRVVTLEVFAKPCQSLKQCCCLAMLWCVLYKPTAAIKQVWRHCLGLVVKSCCWSYFRHNKVTGT